MQPVGVLHQPQPRFLEQVFSDLTAPRQPHQKREQTEIEGVVDGVERRLVTVAKPIEQCELGLPFHQRTNARRAIA